MIQEFSRCPGLHQGNPHMEQITGKEEFKFSENILNFNEYEIIISILIYISTISIFFIFSKSLQVKIKHIFIIFIYHSLFCITFYSYTFFFVNDADTYYFIAKNDTRCSSFLDTFSYRNIIYFINLFEEFGLNYFNIFLVFNFIGSIGILFIFLSLRNLNFNKSKLLNILTYIFVLFPTYNFWSSGIGKDSIVFTLISLIIYTLICNKKNYIIISSLLISIIFLFRPYIAFVLFFSLTCHFLIDVRFSKKIKFIFLSFLFFIAYINNKIILILIDYKYDISIQNILQYINQKRSVGSIQKYEQAAYNFNTYIFDLISYLFKPLNFDISNQFIFLNSLENLVLLIFSIIILSKIRFKKMINIFEAKYTFFFIYFVSSLATLSITITNLGIISRHKIMILGVYFIILFLIYNSQSNKIKTKIIK